MEKIEITMFQDKVTKNTVRYAAEREERDVPPAVPVVYIQKWAIGDPPPTSVKLTVEVSSD